MLSQLNFLCVQFFKDKKEKNTASPGCINLGDHQASTSN